MRYLFLILLFSFSFQLFSQNEVKYMWCGAVTYNSVKVNAKMTSISSDVHLVVAQDSTFSSPDFSVAYVIDSITNYMVSLEIGGLLPYTKYYYAVQADGILDASPEDIGSFTTFANGPFSYSFVIGSCAINSNHKVFDAMRNMVPDFYINMGDLHYRNPNSATNINIHRLPYEDYVLSKPRLAKFLKQTPIVYVWDDHDFSGNDSDSSFVGKKNARIAYHEYVPHYPLAFGPGPWNPIAQSFTAGRVHFILTDLRSERYSEVMKPSQRAWFESECLYARDNNLIIAWMTTYSWSGTGSDNWAAYALERTEINDFFYCNNIRNLFILSGDAHMLGIDDGTNANFSTNTCPGYKYPIFQAAALNNNGSYKGGIYNQGGYFPNPNLYFGQFGKVAVTDPGGDSLCIAFEGYRVDSSGASVTLINSYSFCRYLPLTSIASSPTLLNILSIQPNPSGILNVHFSQLTFLKTIRIYSVTGNLMKTVQVGQYLSDHTASTEELKAGSYIVEFETDRGKVKKHWIKI